MTPYYQDEWCQIFHGDCREILPELPKVDLVLTDPPYGIGWRPRANHTGEDHVWKDDTPFRPGEWLSIGTRHCFWGAQYFAHLLPPSESWLTWVKRPIDFDFSNDSRTYATVELAWTDFGCKAAFHAQVWDGGMRAGDVSNRSFCHPSQKPVELMRWMVGKAGDGTILDPFMGSGTTLRAAKDLNRRAIGIEIEEKYCAIAAKRLEQEVFDFTERTTP